MGEDLFNLGVKGLIKSGKQVLLLQINNGQLTRENREYWDLPGGRVQVGEEMEMALRREIQEETGLTEILNIRSLGMCLSHIRIPTGPQQDVGLILAVFQCEIHPEGEITLSKEHISYGWFTEEEAAELLTVKYPAEFIRLILEA